MRAVSTASAARPAPARATSRCVPPPEWGGSDHCFDEAQLGILGGPDQIAANAISSPAARHSWSDGDDCGHLDLGEPSDHRHDLLDQSTRGSHVAAAEHRDVRAGREVLPLGTHVHRARGAGPRRVGRAREIADEVQADQVQGCIRDHDLADVPIDVKRALAIVARTLASQRPRRLSAESIVSTRPVTTS